MQRQSKLNPSGAMSWLGGLPVSGTAGHESPAAALVEAGSGPDPLPPARSCQNPQLRTSRWSDR